MGTAVQQAVSKKTEAGDLSPETKAGCKALAEVIGQVGDKWTVILVGVLSLGSARFNSLMRSVPGISHRMLTLTLRSLERDGLVSRTVFPTVPLRVDYELTDLGRSLIEPLGNLAGWAALHRNEILSARLSYNRLAP